MSEPYQIASLNPIGLDPRVGVLDVHQTLLGAGILIDEDSLLLLNDGPDGDTEPEPAGRPDAALTRIIGWPTLGSIDYAGPEGTVTVSYLTEHPGGKLNCVLVSTLQRPVDRTNAVHRYQRLAADLHHVLHAARTVMDWGLEARGFNWRAELDRLGRNELDGTYEYADLRLGD